MDISADKQTLEFLRDNLASIRHETVGGHDYFVGAGQVLPCPLPTAPKTPDPIRLTTLSGFARLVARNIDGLDLEEHIIVATPAGVYLYSAMSPLHRVREVVFSAAHKYTLQRVVGDWLSLTNMVVGLGTHFDADGDRDKIIGLLSSVTVSDTVKQQRSGLGFRITTGQSLEGDGWADVDPIVTLHPYRSFPEAFAAESQVPSQYLLEIAVPEGEGEKKITARLTQADANDWVPLAAAKVAARVERELTRAAEAFGIERSDLPVVAC
jgi:hypothetical protein